VLCQRSYTDEVSSMTVDLSKTVIVTYVHATSVDGGLQPFIYKSTIRVILTPLQLV
jgi:hypothetical protein